MATIEISCVEVWRAISSYLEDEISLEMRRRMEAHFMYIQSFQCPSLSFRQIST
jgi:hypothetical protein